MRLTNRHNLPAPLVNAIRNDPYSRGHSDISVTQLIQPPQIRYLARGMEIEEDASDCIWRLLGQAVHTILERACDGKDIAEQRVFSNVRGWVVSGQFDLHQEDHTLNDYKITSVYTRDGKIEWVNQLNLLRALCMRNGMRVDKLQVIAIFRDWRPKEALASDYPKSQVAVIPVEMWPIEEAEAYLDERVRLHQMDIPPPCTNEERWQQPTQWALMQGQVDQWALMQKDRKRAIRLYDEKPTGELKPDQYIEHRPGEPGKRAVRLFDSKPLFMQLGPRQYWEYRPGAYRRCENYCAVSRLCPQWKTYEESQRLNEDATSERQNVADDPRCVETDSVEG